MSGAVVHCITNAVTAQRVADALAALGMQPIMASAVDEVAEVTRRSHALVLNCGTPTSERFDAMRAAAIEARAGAIPVVLDPVGCGGTEWRTRRIRQLGRDAAPAVVRGNAAEVAALADVAGPDLHGTRSDDPGGSVIALARAASAALETVVLATGHGCDAVARGETVRPLSVDAPVLDRVIGGGDVLSAIIGAFLARGSEPLAATIGAHRAFAAAARDAAAAGPGTFWPAFLDRLATHG